MMEGEEKRRKGRRGGEVAHLCGQVGRIHPVQEDGWLRHRHRRLLVPSGESRAWQGGAEEREERKGVSD